MPAGRAILQDLVIGLFAVCNQPFDTDILSDEIPGTIQQKKRQQAAHAAVSIVEGMNAEKVQDEHRHQQKGIQFRIREGFLQCAAQGIHCLRCFPCRDRLEPDSLGPIRQLLGYDIIRVLEAAADSQIAEFIKIPVQLQDHARPDGNKVIVFVHRVQHVTIPSDLAFAPALRGRLVHHDLF